MHDLPSPSTQLTQRRVVQHSAVRENKRYLRSTYIPDFLFMFLFFSFQPLSGSDEEPGLLKLINPVKREGKPDLADIELWPRCVPEGMVFKVMK
jgi:hypothetical protein